MADTERIARKLARAKWRHAALLSIVAAPAFGSAPESKAQVPTLVLLNGAVRIPEGWAEALAIRDGVIIATGSDKAIRAMVSDETQIVDLAGRTVLPGIHDMHVHALFAGIEMSQCQLRPGAPPKEIADAVKACVASAAPGDWIVGGNWVAAVFAPGAQTKAFLDSVAPDNPVLLNDEAHHSVWVNSKALEAAGITRLTPDPEGGVIERDEYGDPTGLLRESATILVESKAPAASEEKRKSALKRSTKEMLSYGITSFTDASIRDENIGIYSALFQSGDIKQRVRGCIVWESRIGAGEEAGFGPSERLVEFRTSYERPRFRLDCIKIFMDGVPTESRTGAMIDPYLDAEGAVGGERGMLMNDQHILNAAVARFDEAGLRIKFHAAGDRAVRAALDAVSFAREKNGWGGPMHHVGHSTLVSKADIPRGRQLSVAWEFSPYIWHPTPMVAVDIAKVVGESRMTRWMPIREALESGALVVAGSDWSVVPSVNPWLAIETMVTRESPGGSKAKQGEVERVTREEALKIMTANGAALMGHRDKVGSIEPGMLADIIVTRTNPYKSPIRKLHKTAVDMTFVEGELVFDRSPRY